MREAATIEARARDDGLRITRFADLRIALDDSDYCIKALLPRPALALVYGEPSSGKTFFAGRAAFDVSTGRDFLGLRTKRGRVAYVAAESPASVRRRFAAWREREGITDAPLVVIEGRIDLLRVGAVDALIERIRAEGGADLILIDTASQAAPGMDENTAEGMGALIGAMALLRDTFSACVLLVHHSGKDNAKGARGWSGLRGAVDAEIEVRGQSGVRTAHVRKARDGEAGREITFELRPFTIGTDDDGDEVTTCEVVASGAESRRQHAHEPTGANQRIVFAALREAVAEHGKLHGGSSVIPQGVRTVDAETLARYALPRLPQEASGRNSAEARKREALNKALRSLQADGLIGVWNDLRWLA
jgi:KaiC/GvpD/RAD55 family RecA-like ATPase